jgi:transcriptional regulator with GAF, ATPase, and Fis domain
MDETLTERQSSPAEEVALLLTRVLSYDDLVAGGAVTLRLFELPLAIRRSTSGPLRVEDGTLHVPDPFLSSSQARLERRGEAVIIVDAGSRNGTFVDGVRVTEQVLDDGALIEVGHTLFCFRRVTARAAAAAVAAPTVGAIRTRSPAMALLLRDLARIAVSRESVLILAETGSGKESFAGEVHALSGRTGAFRAVDCGAIPETLFESTLFGHRRGAFTSAIEARTGEIVRASGGTLFLDEVGNLPPAAQAKLLRVIEDGIVVPVGAAEGQKVDVRWIAATNRDLFAGDFRADLVRRLGGWVARLPSLRDRSEDLGELAAHLLRDAGVTRASISVEAARALFTSDFPGNVREYRANLRSAALLAGDAKIELSHLPLGLQPPSPSASGAVVPPPPVPPRAPGEAPDVAALEAVLESTAGNVVHAARTLGTHPRQVYRWIERAGIALDRFRKRDPG